MYKRKRKRGGVPNGGKSRVGNTGNEGRVQNKKRKRWTEQARKKNGEGSMRRAGSMVASSVGRLMCWTGGLVDW